MTTSSPSKPASPSSSSSSPPRIERAAEPRPSRSHSLFSRAVLPVVIAIVVGLFLAASRARPTSSILSRLQSLSAASTMTAPSVSSSSPSRAPVYFIGHGGPPLMFEPEHPAYQQLAKLGREITQRVKPRAIVAISAHWQGNPAEPDVVEVNTGVKTNIIYDFYNFPAHYYKQEFPNVGDKGVADKIISAVNDAGLKAKGVTRGLDHGIWVPFKAVFEADSNPLTIPVIQLSLYAHDDATAHYKLGQALSPLRDDNIAIIGSGMVVHNLRDYFRFHQLGSLSGGAPTYCRDFDNAAKDAAAITGGDGDRMQAMAALLARPDARSAHYGGFEHLLPLHVAAGAAGADAGKQLWTLHEAGSLSYAQFRFGEVRD